MRKAFVQVVYCFLFLLLSCKDNKEEQSPSVVILAPAQNTEFAVLSQVVVRANISDNEVVESVQVSLISDATNNKVLPSVTFQVRQKEYELDFVFDIADSLLPTGRYYFQVEAYDGENRFSSFRFINIRGMNTEKTGVFVTCENGSTADLYFDQNQFTFQHIHQFGKRYQGAVFNRFNQHFWFIPKNGNEIELFDPQNNRVSFSKVFNSNFSAPFTSVKNNSRDIRFSILDLGVKGFNQNLNENYTYLTPATKKVESIGMGEQLNVVEEVDRNGSNRAIKVLNKNSGVSLRSRTIFDDAIDLQFFDDENVLVFCNNLQGGKAMRFNAVTTSLQTNLFTCDSIREVVKTTIGDFVISTKSSIQIYRPSTNNLTNYLSIGEAVLAYDALNNQVYVGHGTQLKVYNYRQVLPVQSTSMPTKIVGINVRFNQF